MYTIDSFKIGDRVQLHPATDTWMRGDKYGEIVRVGRKVLQVKMDRSGLISFVSPRNVGEIMASGNS